MEDKCIGIMGSIFGHSFSTVMTKEAVRVVPTLEGKEPAVTKVLDAFRNETYHGIFCKRCGKVINA